MKPDFIDIGKMRYKDAWEHQEIYFNKLVNYKNLSIDEQKKENKPEECIIFVEHPNVYTLGKSGKMKNLLVNMVELQNKEIEFYETNRGGDITYHGPGQIVGYPILDIQKRNLGLKEYIYNLEEAVIDLLSDYDIKGEHLKGATGIWLDSENPQKMRKICAIGVKCSRWITMHGFALNVNTDLSFFEMINPCGFNSKQVTSMQKELKNELNIQEVKEKLLLKLYRKFS